MRPTLNSPSEQDMLRYCRRTVAHCTLQKDVPGLMQKKKKKQITSLKMHHPRNIQNNKPFFGIGHIFLPKVDLTPEGTGDPWPSCAPSFLWFRPVVGCTGDSPGSSGVKLIMYGVVGFLRCVWCIKLWDLGGMTAATRVVTGAA